MLPSLARFAVGALALLALAVGAPQQAAAQSCINEKGRPVDWFVAIKLPKNRNYADPNIVAGLAYMYGDANSAVGSAGQFFTASPNSLGDGNGAIARTLQQIYDSSSSSDVGYVMYNDEIPNGGPVSTKYGHTKGQLMWSASQGRGFWLIHSVPKMAGAPASGTSAYEYPSTGVDYGQSFLCISTDISGIDQALLQLQFTNPQVYGKQWVSSLTSQMPNGDAFVNQGSVTKAAVSNIAKITSLGGVSFTHFAKTVAWDQSAFGNLVGPYYGQNIVAETWMRPYEAPNTPPQCQSSVFSVSTLAAPAATSFNGFTWKESEDHSKWGIASDRTYALTCIGDINHQLSQWKRSGGYACFQDPTVNAAFAALITGSDESSSQAEIAANIVHSNMKVAKEDMAQNVLHSSLRMIKASRK